MALSPFARWRADIGITIGTGVAAWADMVSGRVLAQATGANQPSYSASHASFNDQPALTFGGFLISTDPASTWKFTHDGTGMEVYIVALGSVPNNENAGNRHIISTNVGNSAGFFYRRAANSTNLTFQVQNDSGYSNLSVNSNDPSYNQNQAMFYHFWFNASQSPKWGNTVNDSGGLTGNAGQPPSALDPVATLYLGSSNVGGPWLGQIAEVFIFNRTLTSGSGSERAAVAAYMARYGL